MDANEEMSKVYLELKKEMRSGGNKRMRPNWKDEEKLHPKIIPQFMMTKEQIDEANREKELQKKTVYRIDFKIEPAEATDKSFDSFEMPMLTFECVADLKQRVGTKLEREH